MQSLKKPILSPKAQKGAEGKKKSPGLESKTGNEARLWSQEGEVWQEKQRGGEGTRKDRKKDS